MWRNLAFLGTLLMFAVSPALLRAQTETLFLRADEWCPYNCEPTSDHPGYVVEILKDVLAPHGIALDYRIMPWQRAVNAAIQNEVDGVIGAGPNESPELAITKRSVGQNRIGLVVKANASFVYGGLQSLRPISVGIIRGYSYGDAIDEYIAETTRERPAAIRLLSGEMALPQGLRLTDAGRIDGMLENVSVAKNRMMVLGLERNLKIVPLEEGDEIYIAFGKGNPRYERIAPMLDAGIDQLRASGRLSQIMARYGLSDWQ